MRASFFFFSSEAFRSLSITQEEKEGTRSLAGWLCPRWFRLLPFLTRARVSSRSPLSRLALLKEPSFLPRELFSSFGCSIPSLKKTMAEAGVGPASTAADGSLIAIIGDEVRHADAHATGERARESEERAARCLGTFGEGRRKMPLSPDLDLFFLPQPRKTPTTSINETTGHRHGLPARRRRARRPAQAVQLFHRHGQ